LRGGGRVYTRAVATRHPARNAAQELLHQALHSDSRERELRTAQFIAIGTAAFIPVVIAVAGEQDRRIGLSMCAVVAAASVAYAVQIWFHRRGHYRPALSWFNALFESSAPALLVWIAAAIRGPTEAFLLPVDVLWGAVVVVSSMRVRAGLSLAAGAVAA